MASHGEIITPIGSAARNFLRRVRLAGEPLHAEPDELALVQACIEAGYLRRVSSRLGLFAITADGAAYLDRVAGSH
jgi:hypothetical protein